MKKLFSVFLAVVMLSMIFIPSTAQAMNINKFIENTENIRKEFLRIEKQVDLRDFDFFLKMAIVQIASWNETVGGPNIKKEKIIEISKQYTAILSAQYISMQQYINKYVIEKSQNKEQTKSICTKMLQYINEALEALK